MRNGIRSIRPQSVVSSSLLLFLFAACGKGTAEYPEPASSPVRVEVFNDYALALEVFVIGAGTRHRLGTVDPGMRGSFTIPQGMIGSGPLEFQAHTSGAGRAAARSGRLLVPPGSTVHFEIAPQLFNSTAEVRP